MWLADNRKYARPDAERGGIYGDALVAGLGAFGDVVIPGVVKYINWQVIGDALLSLTVARVLPFVVSRAGNAGKIEGTLFLARFGPRGPFI